MYGNTAPKPPDVNPSSQGRAWSYLLVPGQAAINGLGGVGRRISLGDLTLPGSPTSGQMATLVLNVYDIYGREVNLGPGNIRAHVSYGVGAIGKDEVRLDWGPGTSIQLPAGHCNVDAVEIGTSSGIANISGPIRLSAQLVPGPRMSLGWPTYTDVFALEAQSVVHLVIPPRRAKRLWVGDYRGQAGSDLNVTLHMLGNSTALYQLANAADSAIRTDGIVLPGTTTRIDFASAAGTAGNLITACFLLDG